MYANVKMDLDGKETYVKEVALHSLMLWHFNHQLSYAYSILAISSSPQNNVFIPTLSSSFKLYVILHVRTDFAEYQIFVPAIQGGKAIDVKNVSNPIAHMLISQSHCV